MHRFTAICFAILVFLSACAPARAAQPAVSQPAGSNILSLPAATDTLAPTPLPRENRTDQPAPQPKSPIIQKDGPNPEWVALIQLDGNIHMVNASTGWWTQVTEEGNGLPQAGTSPANQATFYCCMSWSSDGKLLAFRGTSVTNSGGGPRYQFNIGVYDAASQKTRVLLQNASPAGLAFRPGTHLLAYDEVIAADYFAGGQPDASKARGIMGLNIDTGEVSELVKPERGLWLSAPRWSPDGNTLGFLEQKQYEAPGAFALYDFQKQAYHAWDQAIGAYTFAPDGQHIAYDRLNYGMTAENSRIWVSDLAGQGETPVSPEGAPAAHAPAWSPKGDQIAYWAGDPGAASDLMVVPASGGEPRKLGSFTNAGPLAWSPDGTRLAFSTGARSEPHAMIVAAADGAVKDLGIGMDPAWEP